jgi:hypothetical protein
VKLKLKLKNETETETETETPTPTPTPGNSTTKTKAGSYTSHKPLCLHSPNAFISKKLHMPSYAGMLHGTCDIDLMLILSV